MTAFLLKPGKDARWLTLELCKEFTKGTCPLSEDECKFAHPPSHVDVQNGKVICCFDYIKSKCQRSTPPCKYLHPPSHLKEQLLEMGRQNLIVKNLQLQSALTSGLLQPVIAVSASASSIPLVSSAKPLAPPSAYQAMLLPNQQYATAPGTQYILPSSMSQYQIISPSYANNNVVQFIGSTAPYASNIIPINLVNGYNNYPLQVIPYMDTLLQQSDPSSKLTQPMIHHHQQQQHLQQQQQQLSSTSSRQLQQVVYQTAMIPDDKSDVRHTSRKRTHDAIDTHSLSAPASFLPSIKRAALIDAKSGLPVIAQVPTQQLSFTQLPLQQQQQQQQPHYLPISFTPQGTTYIQRL